MNHINRRDFLKMGLAGGSLLALGNHPNVLTRVFGKTATSQKVIILGFDGMDPHLTEMWMNAGKLPAFSKLRRQGVFTPLGTSNPPQSPVAWANFITGMNPGGHGLFDFTHRDPEAYIPYFSATETSGATKTLSIGKYRLPISGGSIKNMLKGRAFWQILEDYDIPATIFKMPSNYPPLPTKQRTLAGMNTPEICGDYNRFNYYTTEPARVHEDIGGGRIHEVYVIGHQVETKLPGPINAFHQDEPETEINFKVYLDPVNPVAKIAIQNQEFILKQGEWSDWKKINFSMFLGQGVAGICKFYLKEVRPEFKLYVSSLNIDPMNPAMPISTPESYARELGQKFGPFFTKGLPGEFQAMNSNILDEEEFLTQDEMVLQERKAMYDHELERFDSGLLFYYVSSTDQRSHMFWRHLDPMNPGYDPLLAKKFAKVIPDIYQEADKILDKALQKADKDTIVMVVSDHGFSPFRRAFSLNTWLKEAGYHSLLNPRKQGQDIFFLNTNWSKSSAYGIGLNALYINQRGRESEGIISPGPQKDNLVYEIIKKLEDYRDPLTGEKVILKAYAAKDIYSGPYVDQAPDIVVGFNRGYRISWSSPMGRIPKEIMEDNLVKWSGDHCVSPDVVPGIFLMNRKINMTNPFFYDLTPTILKLFGIKPPPEMSGKAII